MQLIATLKIEKYFLFTAIVSYVYIVKTELPEVIKALVDYKPM